MMKSAFFKVMPVGRATVYLVGLALILAVVASASKEATRGSGARGSWLPQRSLLSAR